MIKVNHLNSKLTCFFKKKHENKMYDQGQLMRISFNLGMYDGWCRERLLFLNIGPRTFKTCIMQTGFPHQYLVGSDPKLII